MVIYRTGVSCGCLPNSINTVVIQSPHTVNLTANASANNIIIENGGTLRWMANASLFIENGGKLEVQNGGTLTRNTFTARVVIDDAWRDVTIISNGTFSISYLDLANFQGDVTISGSSSITIATNLYITGNGSLFESTYGWEPNINITNNLSGNLNIGANLGTSSAAPVSGNLILNNNGIIDLGGQISNVSNESHFYNRSGATWYYNGSNFDLDTRLHAEESNNTFYYDQNANQNIITPVNGYFNLTLSGGGGTKTAQTALDINGDLTINAGATFSVGIFNISVGGDWTNNGSFTDGGRTVTFDGNDLQIITTGGTGGTKDFGNVIIANTYASPDDSYDVDASAIRINGTLTITDGQFQPATTSDFNNITIGANGIFKPDPGSSITVSGNWNNGGTWTHNSGTVVMDGSALQTITSGGDPFYNLTVNNTSTGLSLSDNVQVNNTLTMTDGDINTGSNSLTLGVNTSNIGALSYASGTIIGEFERWLNNTTSYLFPLGTASFYRPVNITFANLTAGSLIGEFHSGDPGDAGLALMENGICIDKQFPEGYWSLTTANSLASNNYSLDLIANGFTNYTITTATRLITRIDEFSDWTLNGTHVDATGSTVRRSGLSILSAEYGLGDRIDISASITPDPATICAGNDLNLDGGPSGGSAPYTTHLWTGSGSGYLSADNIQLPAFNSSSFGSFNLTYTVTDSKGCSASDNISLTVNPVPAITLGYAYSKILSIDHNQVPGSQNLLGFPLLVKITDNDLKDHVENANGYDIIFSDINYNKLSHQLEDYDPASGKLTAWVWIPVLDYDDSTKIRMFYGNPQVSSDQSTNEIWSGNYSGVWHLTDNSDASGNGNDGTSNGTDDISGLIGNAENFNNQNDYFEVGTNGLTTNSGSVEAWANTNGVAAGSLDYIYGHTTQPAYQKRIQLYLDDANRLCLGLGNNHTLRTNIQTFTIGNWYHVVLNWDGTNYEVFVNGISRANGIYAGFSSIYNLADIGNLGNPLIRNEGWNGIIDEVRVLKTVISSDWILTEYNNQKENSTFIIRGSEIPNSICPDTVCLFGENIIYSVPASVPIYNWQVNGGNITTGTGTSSITIDFLGGPTTGNIILSETNTFTCSVADTFDIIIDDFRNPIAICKDTVVYLDATGNITIDSSYINDNSTDDCRVWTITLDQTDFNCDDVGPNSVVMKVSDRKGRTDQCTATVTVIDTISPVAVCQDIDVYLDATGNASIVAADVDGGSTDACGIDNLAIDISSFTCANVGGNTVTLTVTDNNSNSDQCTATVTVIDTISPVAVCQDIDVYLDATGNASIVAADVDGGSTDACGIDNLTIDISSFTCANVGANTVTLTVTDNNGNSDQCTATVTVMDTISPVAVCQDIDAYLDATGNITIAAANVNNGSSDACGIASMVLDVTDFTCANVGANTVTLTVTDNNGNSDQCTATVTVIDTISPVAV
jgi:hypothetical protein